MVFTEKDIQRFTNKFHVVENGCWVWTAGKFNSGYGTFSHERQMRYAHRISYALFVGPVPVGMELDHLCRVRSCVNPDHLDPVSRSENLRRSPITIHRVRAEKTHCVHGHEFTAENTGYCNDGKERYCRICHRMIYKKWRQSHGAEYNRLRRERRKLARITTQ